MCLSRAVANLAAARRWASSTLEIPHAHRTGRNSFRYCFSYKSETEKSNWGTGARLSGVTSRAGGALLGPVFENVRVHALGPPAECPLRRRRPLRCEINSFFSPFDFRIFMI
ncbi:hypothetical protein EVAR_50486_1 [Eumeta japonica]|uniref:Uncharacterized protein n=1 Tax=Eumeta variegata TaxID=151549 RepID=A0A4C1XRZ9_EUMVA|nr:hypothetical protein EVAR_50486_1 [Eumeta japonica]